MTAVTTLPLPTALADVGAPPITEVDTARPLDASGDRITDEDMFRALVFGFTVGTAGMLVVSFLIGLAGGLSVATAGGVAVLPGIFGGLYGGGAPYLTMLMVRSEKREKHAIPR